MTLLERISSIQDQPTSMWQSRYLLRTVSNEAHAVSLCCSKSVYKGYGHHKRLWMAEKSSQSHLRKILSHWWEAWMDGYWKTLDKGGDVANGMVKASRVEGKTRGVEKERNWLLRWGLCTEDVFRSLVWVIGIGKKYKLKSIVDLLFAAKWSQSETIMLNKINQSKQDKYHMLVLK